ncbi:MAG TPA: NAD(P)-dependent oxidoreductase [Edaphocola sp.]|nr:NAD(P)-dependent oxidoreductase [Edaphocola sp.]
MKILVTGGAGYIGTTLVEQLNAREDVAMIYVLDNLSRAPLSFFLGREKLTKIRFVKGDILDSYVLDELVRQVDVIYHLAAFVLSPYSYEQNVQYEQINRWGTLNIVRCIQQSKHKIGRFIYLSSASVYGLHGRVHFQDEPNPTNAYGRSKWEGEQFARLLEGHCTVHILRAANVFGFNPSFREDSVLNHFIFHGIVHNKILIYGDGHQSRPFVPLADVVNALLALLDIPKSTVSYAALFNASLNEIKDWLLANHLPDMEYTYLNPAISYEQQFVEGLKPLSNITPHLDKEFETFRENIRI